MLQQFIKIFQEQETVINDWLEEKRIQVGKEPIYASVDLRNSGEKIVPVDTNLFPAGWNNLCPNYSRKASEYFRQYFDHHFPETKCLLILPEDHTRNLYYFSNLKKLQQILESAGFEVKIGSINQELPEVAKFLTNEKEEITLHKIHRENDNLVVDHHSIDQVIVNNDFSTGVPDLLKGVRQNLLPSPNIGWHYRRKSEHSRLYNELIDEFTQLIKIDPWHFKSHYTVVNDVDFDDPLSREKVAVAVDALIATVKTNNPNNSSSVFIKNNAGTYGIAVIRVNSGDDVRNLNQKLRKQMRVGKGSQEVQSVIIQEGVPTIERVKSLVAEPVMYLVDNKLVGGFYRLNEEKGDIDNLNSKGMQFSKSCFHENMGYENLYDKTVNLENLNRVYEVIACIASIAAGFEVKAITNKP